MFCHSDTARLRTGDNPHSSRCQSSSIIRYFYDSWYDYNYNRNAQGSRLWNAVPTLSLEGRVHHYTKKRRVRPACTVCHQGNFC